MKITKEQQEFIKEAYISTDVCQEWKDSIKENFPKLFKETELEVGKWYKQIDKYETDFLLNYQGDTNGSYGFWNLGYGEWSFSSDDLGLQATPATDKEVEDALIKEAKRRGFKEGVKFKCLYNHIIGGSCVPMLGSDGLLWIEKGCVFRNGIWATPLKTITKEEAEKQLGKTILN
jgi:hypothetical protein